MKNLFELKCCAREPCRMIYEESLAQRRQRATGDNHYYSHSHYYHGHIFSSLFCWPNYFQIQISSKILPRKSMHEKEQHDAIWALSLSLSLSPSVHMHRLELKQANE